MIHVRAVRAKNTKNVTESNISQSRSEALASTTGIKSATGSKNQHKLIYLIIKMKLGIYQHYKGKSYKVIEVATHSETLEKLVIYRAMYGKKKLWARPEKMFNEKILVNGKETKRFKFIDTNQ